jgi:DNA-binding CsgD family transcriptional regulator
MTRATMQPPWSRLLRRVREQVRHLLDPNRAVEVGRTEQLRAVLRYARVQTSLVHAGVILVSVCMLLLTPRSGAGEIAMWILVLAGFTVLRVITAGQALATSTLVLEPIGVALFLAGTGGPDSPFFTLSLAGIWWASRTTSGQTALVHRIDRRSSEGRLVVGAVIEAAPTRSARWIYGLSLVGAYLLLVLPPATRTGLVGGGVQDAVVMIGVSLLSQASARLDWSAHGPAAVVQMPTLGAQQLAIREGLARALQTIDIPVDAILAAGEVGLTALQAEVLAYLLLGLTNQEIADASRVSEAAVRYRLTRLYRTLGVTGRRQAAERARAIGLTLTPRSLTTNPTRPA